MLKRRNKSVGEDHRYIFMSHHEDGVGQWDFSKRQLLAIVTLCIAIIGSGLFITTDYLTKVLYQTKLKSLKRDYNQLSLTLNDLQRQMDQLSTHVVDIEEKDRAFRTYANLPQIDKDIRKLGIGGMEVAKPVTLDNVSPTAESKLLDLEMNVDMLTRKVKLNWLVIRIYIEKLSRNQTA